jgi:hypothetical protein
MSWEAPSSWSMLTGCRWELEVDGWIASASRLGPLFGATCAARVATLAADDWRPACCIGVVTFNAIFKGMAAT